MDTLDNPFVVAHDPDLVDKIRKILSGPPEGDEKEEQKEKVDGRTKVYKTTTTRLTDGKRRSKVNTSFDGRTKAYRETVKRIEARRTKKTEKSEED